MSPFPRGTVSLERALSKLGVASRGEARRLIAEGRVSVDGQLVRAPLQAVNPDRARIEVDGARVRKATAVVLMMHKPAGIVTTRADERGRRTVTDLLPKDAPFVAPVGRLDLDSSGLLLLTNDSRLADQVTAPGTCAKVYEVEVDRPLTDEVCARFRAGMTLQGGERLAPVEIAVDPTRPTHARLTLHEGRNRQIRRMCGETGYAVVTLHRVTIGPLSLDDLAVGAVRALSATEEKALRAAVEPPRRGRRATSSRPGS
ncbi:MAG: pseudouridine synthase [Planctomycetota bacterium]